MKVSALRLTIPLDKQGQEIASTPWKEFMAKMTTSAKTPKLQ